MRHIGWPVSQCEHTFSKTADNLAGNGCQFDPNGFRFIIVACLAGHPMRCEAIVRSEHCACQIDLAPTLLGLLQVDYTSTFFGRDLLSGPPWPGRAVIGNYQHLGLYDGERIRGRVPCFGNAG